MQHIECAVTDTIGVFIPSTGQCGYAVTPRHVHPAYSVVLSFEADSPVAPKGIIPKSDEYGCTAMSPCIPHEEEQSEEFTRFVAILIEVSTFERVWSSYTSKNCGPFFWTPFVVPQSIMFHIKEFISEFNAGKANCEEVLEAIGTCITHAIIRAMLEISVSVEKITLRFEIQRAIEFMHAQYGKKISVPELAVKVNCSESHFSRLFKQETGDSPAEYLVKLRVDKARKLLSKTLKNATEIALECGFSSTAHFSDTFRKNVGVSPLQYRKNFS